MESQLTNDKLQQLQYCLVGEKMREMKLRQKPKILTQLLALRKPEIQPMPKGKRTRIYLLIISQSLYNFNLINIIFTINKKAATTLYSVKICFMESQRTKNNNNSLKQLEYCLISEKMLENETRTETQKLSSAVSNKKSRNSTNAKRNWENEYRFICWFQFFKISRETNKRTENNNERKLKWNEASWNHNEPTTT